MTKIPLNKKIGILGGGQLAQMLCTQGQKLGLQVHVLSKNNNDPAALVTPHWHKGDISDKRALNQFCKQMDILTFESEFADTSLLKKFNRKFKPSLKNISMLQDRLSQKNSLIDNKLPTSTFIQTKNQTDLIQFYNTHKSFVAKKRMFGYDGYGTFIIKTKKELQLFLKNNANNLSSFIIEKFIPFNKELSLVCSRSKSGDIQFFPLVESFQKEAKCFWVKGPVANKKVNSLKTKVKTYLNSINYQGVIAFELFESKNGLLINEVAPRVHNTGHHSLDSCHLDQFSAHLYCLLGLQLPKISPKTKGFAMVNLIGSSTRPAQLYTCKASRLHWYLKKDNRSGRKMGHINTCADSADKALKLALKDLKGFKI